MALALDSLTNQNQNFSAAAPKASRFSDLSSEQFTRIMFAELKNQDPLKPNDSAQLLDQIANLRSIESNLSMEGKLKALVSQNQLSTAGTLIGASISGISETNERVTGIVRAVNRTDAGPVLMLKSGVRVPFDMVDSITLPDVPSNNNPPATPLPPTPPVVVVPPVVIVPPAVTVPGANLPAVTTPSLGTIPRQVTPVPSNSESPS